MKANTGARTRATADHGQSLVGTGQRCPARVCPTPATLNINLLHRRGQSTSYRREKPQAAELCDRRQKHDDGTERLRTKKTRSLCTRERAWHKSATTARRDKVSDAGVYSVTAETIARLPSGKHVQFSVGLNLFETTRFMSIADFAYIRHCHGNAIPCDRVSKRAAHF